MNCRIQAMYRFYAVEIHVNQPVGIGLVCVYDLVQVGISCTCNRATPLAGSKSYIYRIGQITGAAAQQSEAVVIVLPGCGPV